MLGIHQFKKKKLNTFIKCSLFSVLACTQHSAFAQQENPVIEEVVVTGSRVSRDGFDSPQPLTVIGAEQIQSLGIVNVGDILRTLPQNTPFFSETNVGFGNFNVGAQIANLRGLNPFFGTRTLTLVDTKRMIPTSEGGSTDISLIPSMLVDRTEVITGGASAAYGSDAIAGVVNVILDKDLVGFKAQADYGQTSERDGEDKHLSMAFGSAFGESDRGHLIFGGEYQSQGEIGPCSENRDWCAESWGVGTNAGFSSGNGLPNFVVASDGKFPTSDTGLFTPFGGAEQQFSADGTELLPYDGGEFPGVFARFGGSGSLSAYRLSAIRPTIERYALMTRASYEINDSLNFYIEGNYAKSESENNPSNGALGPLASLIAPDNAFLTPEILASAPAGGSFRRVFMPSEVSARNETNNETIRFVAGVEGQFSDRWDWDAYYQYGNNENGQRLHHNATGSLLFFLPTTYNFLGWSMDAVRSDPGDPNSSIVCRATLPGPAFNALAEGCIPLNLFGTGTSDQAAIDYAFRTLVEDAEYDQDVFGFNVRGELAEGWAGPIQSAFGFEWRKDKNSVTHDRENQPWADDFFLSWGLDRGGEIKVREAYAEFHIPVAENLQTDVAYRRTQTEATDALSNDSADNSFSSWKFGGNYEPVDWLRFRFTRSRDVRAAGFRELFLPRDESIGTAGAFPGAITNPWNSNIPEDYLDITGGNPALKPEEADTTTFGAVLSFDNLRLSADWFEIDIQDAITPGGLGGLSSQSLIDACFAGGAAACAKIEGEGTTDISSVDARSINIGSFLTRGVDLEASYNFQLNNDADLNLRVISSYLYDLLVDTGLGNQPVNYKGQSGPVASFGGFNTSPEWQTTAWLTYSQGQFKSTLEGKYIGEGSLNALWFESPAGASSNTLPFSVSDNDVDSRLYFTWSGSYEFSKTEERSTEFFWVVNNLFDKEPPVAPGGNTYPTNPVFFDTIGRRYRVGFRVQF